MKTFFITLIGAIFCLTTFSTVAQPTITVDGDLEFCYGDTTTLCVEPTYSALIWNTGATTNCISATESGEYYAVVLDQNSNIDSTLFYNPTTVIVHEPEPTFGLNDDTLFVTDQFETYQWYYVGGQEIEGATDSFIVTSLAAECYFVVVTDSFGCTGQSFSIGWGSSCGNSIETIDVILPDIFPNPTTGKTRLDFRKTVNDLGLNVFSPIGSLIYSRQLDGIQYFDLELPETNGLYFIHLLDSEGQKTTLKVLKE